MSPNYLILFLATPSDAQNYLCYGIPVGEPKSAICKACTLLILTPSPYFNIKMSTLGQYEHFIKE